MGIGRGEKRDRRRRDAAETRACNKPVKDKERARRDVRMREKVRQGSLPYTPAVMSWLSRTVGKPAGRITPEDIQALLA